MQVQIVKNTANKKKKKIRSKSFELANKAKWRSEITEICGELRLSRVKKSVCRAAYRPKAKERSGKVDRGKGEEGIDTVLCPIQTRTDKHAEDTEGRVKETWRTVMDEPA